MPDKPHPRTPGMIALDLHGDLLDAVDDILCGPVDQVPDALAALAARDDLLDLWGLLGDEGRRLLARMAWDSRIVHVPQLGGDADEANAVAVRFQERARKHAAHDGGILRFTESPGVEVPTAAVGLACAVALLAAIRQPVITRHLPEGADGFAQRSLLMQISGTLDRACGIRRAQRAPFLQSSWLHSTPEVRAAVVARAAWVGRDYPFDHRVGGLSRDAHQAAQGADEPPKVEPLPFADRGRHLLAALVLIGAIPPEERSALWATSSTN